MNWRHTCSLQTKGKQLKCDKEGERKRERVISWYGMAWHGELVSNSQAHCTICVAQAKRKERHSREQTKAEKQKKRTSNTILDTLFTGKIMRQRFAARALWQICWICSRKAFVRWCRLLLPNNPTKISFCCFYFISIRRFRLVFFAPCFCYIYAKDNEIPSTTPTIIEGICATFRNNTVFSSSTKYSLHFYPTKSYTPYAPKWKREEARTFGMQCICN